jgi:hypothetical protein
MRRLGEREVGRIRLARLVVLVPLVEHTRLGGGGRRVMDGLLGGAFDEGLGPVHFPGPRPARGVPMSRDVMEVREEDAVKGISKSIYVRQVR